MRLLLRMDLLQATGAKGQKLWGARHSVPEEDQGPELQYYAGCPPGACKPECQATLTYGQGAHGRWPTEL